MARAPFARVEHLLIAVRDPTAAERDYTALLGRSPSARGTRPAFGTANVIFRLASCSLELMAPVGAPPSHPVALALATFLDAQPEGLFALALGSDALEDTAHALRTAGFELGEPADLETPAADGARRTARLVPIAPACSRGVQTFAAQHDPAALALAAARGDERAAPSAVDHIVLLSDDLEGALRLWRDALAIPERWRRELPRRGTVNVGLRLGGVTLELVAPLAAAGDGGDRLWGVAYAVPDCEAAVARLRAESVPVGDPRPGLAPATRVASVKREGGVPTLLIQHTGR